MKICAEHWAALRAGITDRGLGHLVATSGQEATRRVEAELAGVDEPTNYDPLLAANFAIWARALDAGGLALLARADLCPLCEGERHVTGLAADWIEGCLDAQLEHARVLGLAPRVQ